MDSNQLRTYFLGKDGVRPFIGVVTPPSSWISKTEPPNKDYKSDVPWNGRCKVRIMGYHGYDNLTKVKDEDCPWAYILMPPSSGTSGRSLNADSYNLRGGERVFGLWLDEEDGQIPLIVGTFPTTPHAVEETTPERAASSGDGYAHMNPTKDGTFATNDKHQPDSMSSFASPSASSGASQTAGGGGVGGSNPTGDAYIKSVDAVAGGYTKADKEARDDAQKKVAQVTTCDPNVLAKIQTALEDFLKAIAKITAVIPNIPIVPPSQSNPDQRGGPLPPNFNQLPYDQQIIIIRENALRNIITVPVPPINQCVNGTEETIQIPCFDITIIDYENWQPFDPNLTYIDADRQTTANPNQVALSYALLILGYLQWIFNNFFQQQLGALSDTLQLALNPVPVLQRKFIRENTFNPLLDKLSCILFIMLQALLPLLLGLLGNMGSGRGNNNGGAGTPISPGPGMSMQFIACVSEEVAKMYLEMVQPIYDEIDNTLNDINNSYGGQGGSSSSNAGNGFGAGAAAALGLILLLLNVINQCDQHRCEQPKTYTTGIKGDPEQPS